MHYTSVKKYGNNIFERYIDDNGDPHARKVPYEPSLFIHTEKDPLSIYRDIYGKACKRIQFDSIQSANQFIRKNKNIVEILGMDDYEIAYISDIWKDRQLDLKHIRLALVDIETPSKGFPSPILAEKEISHICHYDSIEQKFFMFAVPPDPEQTWDPKKSILEEDFLKTCEYIECPTERDLLIKYLQFWTEHYPDVASGWNSDGFDFPYIIKRIQIVLGQAAANRLSPWGRGVKTELKVVSEDVDEENFDEDEITQDDVKNFSISAEIFGVELLDELKAYKKVVLDPRPNHKLDTIGEIECNEHKVTFDQSNYLDFYKQDYQLMTCYCFKDVRLAHMINEATGCIDIIINMGSMMGVNFVDSLATVKPWDARIFNTLKRDHIVVPECKHNPKKRYMGAYVFPTVNRLCRCIASFDYTSLYPSCMMQWGISPENFVGKLEMPADLPTTIDMIVNGQFMYQFDHNLYCVSANGCLYKKDSMGVIPTEVQIIFKQRKAEKKLKLEWESKAAAINDFLVSHGVNTEMVEFYRGNIKMLKGADPEYLGDMDPEELEEKARLMLDYKFQEGKHDKLQHALKILINSVYGAVGQNSFRYYSLDNAEAVTSCGQLAIKLVAKQIDKGVNIIAKKMSEKYNVEYKNSNKISNILAGDTDSTYIDLEPILKIKYPDLANYKYDQPEYLEVIEEMDKVGHFIENKIINPTCDYLTKMMNNPEKHLFMDREALAMRGLWTGKKKHYALAVSDMEGVKHNPPKLKIMGIECKRSSTPKLAQKIIEEAIDKILLHDEEDLQQLMIDYKKQWYEAPYEDVCYVSTANNIAKYTRPDDYPGKKCPAHIKGVIAYNRDGKHRGYDPILEGEKISVAYMRTPNIFDTDSFAIVSGGELPPEMDQKSFLNSIDYDKLYLKKVYTPIERLTDAVGWSIKKRESLEEFF